MKLMVVDVTGSGRPPGTLYLEGKITPAELKAGALQALELFDPFDLYRVEVKDGKGAPTTKITSDCIIFVSISSDASSRKPGDPLRILRDLERFGNIFEDKE